MLVARSINGPVGNDEAVECASSDADEITWNFLPAREEAIASLSGGVCRRRAADLDS